MMNMFKGAGAGGKDAGHLGRSRKAEYLVQAPDLNLIFGRGEAGEKGPDLQPGLSIPAKARTLHRGFEKSCESASWRGSLDLASSLGGTTTNFQRLGFVFAMEKLFKIETTPRSQFIRTLQSEISRVASHFGCLCSGALELGSYSAFLYGLEGRDLALRMADVASESTPVVGGLSQDLNPEFSADWATAREGLLNARLNLQKVLSRSRIFLDRVQGTGQFTQEEALSMSLTGPSLRSTGVEYDLRKDHPYFAYGELDFAVPVGTVGDNHDRYLILLEEIIQSIKIIDQCIVKMPAGAVMSDNPLAETLALEPPGPEEVESAMTEAAAEEANDAESAAEDQESAPEDEVASDAEDEQAEAQGDEPQDESPSEAPVQEEAPKLPEGEIYSYTEAAQGELGFFVSSNGEMKPFRVSVRFPPFYQLSSLVR
jgi:NADH-quinone oxidoreductase subunit D